MSRIIPLVLILTLSVIALNAHRAQAQESESPYVQYLTFYLKPKLDKIPEFRANLADHNQTYHKEAPFRVGIFGVMNGPHSGEFVFTMGPSTWTHMAQREPGDGHGADWQNNVLALAEEISEMEYWRLEEDHVYMPEGLTGTTARVRIIDVKPGEGGRLRSEVLTPILEVYKAKNYKTGVQLWNSQVRYENDRDVAWVSWYPGLEAMDEPGTFVADYNEVHGEGSFDKMWEVWREVQLSTKDELRNVIPELGSGEE